MEIIAIVLLVVLVGASYQWGYSKREHEFQSKPVQYLVNGVQSVLVDNKGEKTRIIIQQESLVDIRRFNQ